MSEAINSQPLDFLADNDIDTPFFSLEIVGLQGRTHGRSCHLHDCCGQFLKVGDVVRLKRACLHDTEAGTSEEAIKVVKIVQGTEGCTVGFLPRSVITHNLVTNHVDKFGIVQVLFASCENPYLKERDDAYCGCAGIVMLNDIPSYE